MKSLKASLIIAVLLSLSSASFAADDYVLLLKQSPVDGGMIQQSPSQDGLMSIVAQPKNGYKFVYWLGDVADISSASTTVSTDSPKLVVAVFERTDFQSETVAAAGGYGENLNTPSNGRIDAGGPAPDQTVGVAPSAPGAKRYSYPSYGSYDLPDEEIDDFPVPDSPEVPEPTSAVLFGLAAIKLLTRKNKKD